MAVINNASSPPQTYDPQYELMSLVSRVDITTGMDVLIRPGVRIDMLDVLDQKLYDILEAIDEWQLVVWRGGKFSTLCYKYHGTTSAQFLILMFNGLSHQLQLRPGMELRIPTINSIQSAIRFTNKPVTSLGEIVTI